MDGSRAATWLRKTIYSMVSTVGPDPHGKVPDPWIHSLNLQVGTRTSAKYRPDPRDESWISLCGAQAAHKEVPGF
jgi:hypothetical protein